MKRNVVWAAVFVLALATPALAQENPKTPETQPIPPDRETSARNPHAQIGTAGYINIGDLAPDFELDGSHGVPVLLSRMRGEWVLLVFSDRREQVVALRTIQEELRVAGVRIIGVCHEKARTLDTYAARDSVPLMLADVTGEVATMYGLYDSQHRKIVPGFMVLDRQGVVRIAFFGQALPADEISRLTHFAVGSL